ncbi:MAG: ABC transporter substrate-binding protein [Candidatus Rokuibacteriota bacterium]|nr:MAG: ABC transporter substrate-binding protein [Candidatus Rokubacteria bacterium]
MRLIGLAIVLTVSFILAPLAAAQQPTKLPRIGYIVLSPTSETPSPERAAFLTGLRELGWIEGKTIAIEYRSAKWNVELLEDLAEDLVRMKVDVIVTAGGGAPLRAAKQATSTIPIVMARSVDPVAEGLVATLARPGGNVTGVSFMIPELGSKRLELLKEIAPRVTRLAVLWNPATGGSDLELRATRAAASKLGVALKLMEVRNADDLVRVFAALEKERPDALTMFFDELTTGYRELVGDFAKKHRLPTVFGAKEFAEAGGLMSYAPNVPEAFRRAASYVDKILKGAKPGDLPIEQPTKFEFVINLKTAKALGLTIPQSLLVRADEVIQ